MKQTIILATLTGMILLACSKKDETTPLTADFTVTVTGNAPNAQLTIVNNSVGATTNTWTFGEGASISNSSDTTPTGIIVDKKGELTIKLVVSNGKETKEITNTVSIAGNNSVKTYTGLEFSLKAGSSTYGRFFSFETEKMYKDNEINATTSPKVNLAFATIGSTVYYFETPTEKSLGLTGALNTDIINYPDKTITVADFDAMMDDSKLANLKITTDNESFGAGNIPGIVFFQLSTGKKGIIRTKSINADRIVVDIKIQKY